MKIEGRSRRLIMRDVTIIIGIIGLAALGVTSNVQRNRNLEEQVRTLEAQNAPMKLDTARNTVSAPATVISVDGWIYCHSMNGSPPGPEDLGLAGDGKILAVQDQNGVQLWAAVREKGIYTSLYYWTWKKFYIRPTVQSPD